MIDDTYLHERTEDTTPEKAISIFQEMIMDMVTNRGIGLAANQSGYNQRTFIIALPGGVEMCINHQIIWTSKDTYLNTEGCLSLPGNTYQVTRHEQVRLRWTNLLGHTQTRKFKGPQAACVQHEMDHLDGITIKDYHENK